MSKVCSFLQLANATELAFFKEVATKLADNDLALYPDSMESLQYNLRCTNKLEMLKGVPLDPNSMDSNVSGAI